MNPRPPARPGEAAPARREYFPRSYQDGITSFILDVKRCAIFASMGMGKGVSTLTALDAMFLAGESNPALVLGPKRVARDVWPNEARKWKHLRQVNVLPILGSEKERRISLKYEASVHSINYEQLPWLVEYWGNRWPYRTVVSDESTRLKSYRGSVRSNEQGTEWVQGAGSMRARALGRIAHTHINRFVELTGTPAPNGLQNLWGQMWFLDAGARLGRTYESFKQRWFEKGYDGYSVQPRDYAEAQIHDAIRDICITFDARDYFDIKDPLINNIYVKMPVKARQHYKEMENEMFTELEGREVEAFGAAARTQKLLQLANGAVYVNPDVTSDDQQIAREFKVAHDEKLDALESCLENANGMPQLVAYEFKSDLARILKRFPTQAADISTPEGEKRFRAGTLPLGCAHAKSMGHGVDGLQDVTHITTFFGHNWDLELYDQLLGRTGSVRQIQSGRDHVVPIVNNIIAEDTMDEVVIARRDNKRSIQDSLLEAMKRRKR